MSKYGLTVNIWDSIYFHGIHPWSQQHNRLPRLDYVLLSLIYWFVYCCPETLLNAHCLLSNDREICHKLPPQKKIVGKWLSIWLGSREKQQEGKCNLQFIFDHTEIKKFTIRSQRYVKIYFCLLHLNKTVTLKIIEGSNAFSVHLLLFHYNLHWS